MIIAISIIASFLLGSIPTGYLITKKFCGVDIRTKGSGNIGSTNVKRVAGRRLSLITQAVDIMKAVIPMVLGIYLANTTNLPVTKNIYLSMIALAVILGHDFTPFLAFKGGKGVNTTIGAFLWIAPIPTLAGIAVHFILHLFTNIVSIRSIVIGITIPVLCVIMKFNVSIVVSAVIAGTLMIIRHKDNLVRLVHNEEK